MFGRSSVRSARRGTMSLGAHLGELRNRLARAAAGVLAGAVAGWFIAEPVLAEMRAPITTIAQQQHRLAALNYDNISGAFDLRMAVAVTVGIVLSSPIWLYQSAAFLVPALTRREARTAAAFAAFAVPLFLAGCATGWVLIPRIVTLMLGFAQQSSASLIQANDYFGFVLRFVLMSGLAFLAPVLLVVLNQLGFLSARTIIRAWRGALIVIILFAGVVTPSADLVSMFLLTVPLVVLYLGAAAVTAVHDRRRDRRLAALTAEIAS